MSTRRGQTVTSKPLLIINAWWDSPFTILRCKQLNGRTIELKVRDTHPRFWTTRNPKTCPDHPKVLSHGRRGGGGAGGPSGFRTLKDEILFEVRVKEPSDIREVRDSFYPHYGADVPWRNLVRWMHGWKAVIEVDKQFISKPSIHPRNIKQARSATVSDFSLNLLYYDIETEDSIDWKNAPARIVSIAIYDEATGIHEVATTAPTSERQVAKFLSSKRALESVVEHTSPIPPIEKDRIVVTNLTHEDADTNEAALLHWLHRRIESCNPDLIAGQNILGYDHHYCINRCNRMNREMLKKHGRLDPEHTFPDLSILKQMPSFDTKIAYAEQARGELVSSSLSHMATETLGYGKVPRTSIVKLMKADPMMLAVYNVWDNVCAARCMKKLDLLSFYLLKTGFHNSTLHHSHSNMMLIEDMMGHLLFERRTIMPSVRMVKEGLSTLGIEKGGFVMDAPSGVWEHAFEVDNSMEYPSAIIDGNMGPDTKVSEDDYPLGFPFDTTETPGGRFYRRDRLSIMSEVLKTLAIERDSIKKRMRETDDPDEMKRLDQQQRVMKENMNSWYGVLGSGMTEKTKNRPFRLADPEIGSDITEIARRHNEWNRQHINEKSLWITEDGVYPEEVEGSIEIHFETLYQDTDSCKVAIANHADVLAHAGALSKSHVVSMATMLCDYLNGTFDDFVKATLGIDKSRFFHIKPDAYYRRYFQWGVKKRYAYLDFDGNYGWRGVEIRRSSTPKFVKKIQRQLLETVLIGSDRVGVDALLRDIIMSQSELWPSTDFGQPFGIRKRGSHAFKSAMWSNEHLGTQFEIGDKPVLYIAKSAKAALPSHRKVAIEYSEKPEDFDIVVDREATIEKFCVESASMTAILKALGTTWKRAMSGVGTSGLMEWAK